MKKFNLFAILCIAMSLTFVSCDNDDDDVTPKADLSEALIGDYDVAIIDQDNQAVKEGVKLTVSRSGKNKVKIGVKAFSFTIPGGEVSIPDYSSSSDITLSGQVGKVKVDKYIQKVNESFLKGNIELTGDVVSSVKLASGKSAGEVLPQNLEFNLKIIPDGEGKGGYTVKIKNNYKAPK